jgi:hypothetical protein
MLLTNTLLTLHMDSETATSSVTENLRQAGLQIVQSFDLQTARATHEDCTCPYHGTEQCNCQMVVLLIYPQVGEPATLVIHSHNEQTSISLVDNPGQRPSLDVVDLISKALSDIAN